jgi:anti-anti-sigma regulatory factor
MTDVEFDRPNVVLRFAFSNRVLPQETESTIGRVRTLLSDLQPGFRMLTNLSALEFMDPACAKHIERTMDLCREAGVSKIVRVIPDPHKDIGFSIMSLFHYDRHVQVVTCKTLEEAEQILGISSAD